MAKNAPVTDPFQGVLTDRQRQDCQRCIDAAPYIDKLMDQMQATGTDVTQAREIRQRQLDRLNAYMQQFFPSASG